MGCNSRNDDIQVLGTYSLKTKQGSFMRNESLIAKRTLGRENYGLIDKKRMQFGITSAAQDSVINGLFISVF